MVMVRSRNLGLLIVIFCFMVLSSAAASSVFAGEKTGNFTGTWTANGSRESLPFGENRQIALIRLSGHVNLKDSVGQTKDYWSTCIGLVDSENGSNARCVWRSLEGQEIYIVLKTDRLAEEIKVTGEIVGGTGGARGIKGSLQFQWSTMSFHETNNKTAVGGYARDLKGSFQLP